MVNRKHYMYCQVRRWNNSIEARKLLTHCCHELLFHGYVEDSAIVLRKFVDDGRDRIHGFAY